MAFEPKLNSCGLFRNDRNDKSDLTGQIEIECPECHAATSWWVNGWRKTAKSGLAYISIALKLMPIHSSLSYSWPDWLEK